MFVREPPQTNSELCDNASNNQNVTSNPHVSTQSNETANNDQSATLTPEDSNQSNDNAHTENQMFGLQNIDVETDPSTWPDIISHKMREFIVNSVENSPILFTDNSFPKSNGRSFNAKLFYSIALNQLKKSNAHGSSLIISYFVLFNEERTKLSTPGSGFKDWSTNLQICIVSCYLV